MAGHCAWRYRWGTVAGWFARPRPGPNLSPVRRKERQTPGSERVTLCWRLVSPITPPDGLRSRGRPVSATAAHPARCAVIDAYPTRSTHVRRTTKLAPLLAAAMVLAACGGDDQSGGTDEGGGGGSAGEPQARRRDDRPRGHRLRRLLADRARSGHQHHRRRQPPEMSPIYGGLFRLRADDDGTNARVEREPGRELRAAPTTAPSFTDQDCARASSSATAPRWTPRRSPSTSGALAGVPVHLQAHAGRWPRTASPWSTRTTVVLTFTRPFAAVSAVFPASNVNWIASPTALQQLGEDALQDQSGRRGPVHGRVQPAELASSCWSATRTTSRRACPTSTS